MLRNRANLLAIWYREKIISVPRRKARDYSAMCPTYKTDTRKNTTYYI